MGRNDRPSPLLGHVSRRLEWAIAFALIALGAWLRLRSLSEMEFKADELKALQLGMQILSDQPWMASAPWPTHGMPSSNGVGNAPLFSWIVAGAWTLSPDPVGVTRLIALANVVCLYPLFRWCRRQMSAETALLVLAILAVNPFNVMFSRKIWGQDLLCVGVVLALWAIEWLRSTKPWRGVALLLLAIVFLGQMHQSGPIALAVLPIAPVCQWLVDRRAGQKWQPWPAPSKLEIVAVLGSLALALFLWIPYLSYLSQVPLKTLQERPRIPGRRESLQFFWRVADQVRPSDLLYLFRPDRDDFFAHPWHRRAFDFCMWIGRPLLIYGVWRWLRKPHTLPVVGFWWIATIVVFALAMIPTHPFYVLVLMPLPALIAGGAFDARLPRIVATVLSVSRVAYVIALAVLTISVQNWLFSRGGAGTGMEGGYGVPYSIRVEQAHAIAERLSRGDALTMALETPEELVCDELPTELIWILDRAHPEVGPVLATKGMFVCDGFTGPEGARFYRWTLKSGS